MNNFEMTGREYSICRVMTDFTSLVRDQEYADRVGCFLEAYKCRCDFPGPDMVELMAGDIPEGDVDIVELKRKYRRAVVDVMFKRAGYEPTEKELTTFMAKRKAAREEFLGFQAKHREAAPEC